MARRRNKKPRRSYISGPPLSEEERRKQERNAVWILIGMFLLFVLGTIFMWWIRKNFL